MNCVFLIYWTVCIQALSAEIFSLLYPALYSSQCFFHKCERGFCSTVTSEDAAELCCQHLLSHRGRLTRDAHLLEKIRIPWHGFPTLVSTVMFRCSACSGTLWLLKEILPPYLVLSSFGFWHKCKCAWSEGSAPLAARGEGAEIKGEHKGPCRGAHLTTAYTLWRWRFL